MANKQNKKSIQKPEAHNKPAAANNTKLSIKFTLNFKIALLLGALSLVVYANTLKNGFVFDDSSVVVGNSLVMKGTSAIPEILVTPYRKGFFNTTNDLYRPLSIALFATEYSAFEKNPMPYHMVNILLFAGCVILLFLFFDKLFEHKRTNIALIASLLFSLHPIHTEVVANIKSCDELLCFFFAFLSLNIFINYLNSGKAVLLAAGMLSFFLSLLAKETSITFLAVIPLIFYYYRNENKKRSGIITIGAIFSAVIFLAIRFAVLNKYNAGHLSDVQFIENALARPGLPLASRIATAILILGDYIKLLLLPYPLLCDYSYSSIPFVQFSHPLVLLSLATYLFISFYGIKSLAGKRKDAFAFAGLYFLITISLFTNIPFLIGTTMGERLIFFSSAGFCLAAALVLEKLTATTGTGVASVFTDPKLRGSLIAISVVYLLLTISRNSDWTDNTTLFKKDIQKAPDNCRLNYYLGHGLENTVAVQEPDILKQKQDREEAISYFRRAVQACPEYADAQADLGYEYFQIGMLDSAEAHDRTALKLEPGYSEVTINLGQLYFAQKKFQQAIDICKRGIVHTPEDARLYSNISTCFGSMGKFDSAIYYARIGASVDPGINAFYENIALSYKLSGNMDSAIKYEAIAQRNNPGFHVR